MRATIVGAGIAGLTAALALARHGIDVEVFERAQVLKEAGAGLQLSPNATHALASLGLLPGLQKIGFEPQSAEVYRASDGILLLANPLGATARARWGAPYLQVHRSDLQALLLAALKEYRRVSIHLGEEVAGALSDHQSAYVQLKSGRLVVSDFALGCDGVRSVVREALFGKETLQFTGQVAWRGVVATDDLPRGLIPPKAVVWTGRERHFVHYYISGGRAVNFIGVVEQDWRHEGWTMPGDPDQLQQEFSHWPDEVRHLCAAVRQPFRWALYGRPKMTQWTKGRISLVGDACHPMLPFLAQGAAMAIEDAVVLANRLKVLEDPTLALKAYFSARIERTAKVQAWSRRNARLFHLPGPAAGLAFSAARIADRMTGSDPLDRMEWLYGYEAL